MSFILSVISVEPQTSLDVKFENIYVEEIVVDERSPFRAGYIPGLQRYFKKTPISGRGYYVLVDDSSGYRTSEAFCLYPAEDGEPIRLQIGDKYRTEFDELLRLLVKRSDKHLVVLVFECNGNVTSPTTSDSDMDAVDLLGPLTVDEFWDRHDQKQILEDSIVIISEGGERDTEGSVLT